MFKSASLNLVALRSGIQVQMHLMMFVKELWLRTCQTNTPEIATGVNLVSKHDLYILPEIITGPKTLH